MGLHQLHQVQFHIKPLFPQVFVDVQHTQRPRWLFILERYNDKFYQVDNISNDVVIYWTMIGTHVVPDRQKHDGHTTITSCKRSYDTRCKYFISNLSFNEYSTTSHTQRPRWLFILEKYKLCDHVPTTQAAMIRCTSKYQVDSSSSYVVMCWTMDNGRRTRCTR